MKHRIGLINIFSILILALLAYFYFSTPISVPNKIEDKATFKRGPHQGRLLETDHFQTEITIFEPEGVPPRFRVYFYDNGALVKPSDVQFQMKLTRINRIENIPFREKNDFLESDVEASEPHSFKVNINAQYKGKNYEWEYESYEGRVQLSKEAIQANAIKVEQAKPVVLEIKLNALGKIMPNEELTVHMSARYPGVVKAVNKKLGDGVQKGETLAVIESNESLRNYEVKSEISGLVIKKDINIGMTVSGQENIFVVSNLKTVWADFNIYRHDLAQIKIGDPIVVKSLDGSLNQQSTISYLSPLGHEGTQSVIARAVLSNPEELLWIPGLFISGDITVDKISVPVAIKDSALQTFRDWDVVFLSVGDLFEVAPVKLGRRNNEWVEIVSGLSAGDGYVSQNSFILKADLEKSGAKHEH